MDFLATYWWAFLVVAILCVATALGLQLRNMKKLSEGDGNIFGRFAFVAVFMLAGGVNFLLTAIGVVVAIINHSK